MKFKKLLFLFFSVSCGVLAQDKRIIKFSLSPKVAQTIYCSSLDKATTTVMFPGRIKEIYAAQVLSSDKLESGFSFPFILDWNPGSNYFTLKSMAKTGAKGSINIIYNNEIYVIDLESVKSGYRAVTFELPKLAITSSARRMPANPSILLSLMDKVKSYHLLKKHNPEQIDDLTYFAPKNSVVDYKSHSIKLLEVIGTPRVDTLFFRVSIENKMDSKLIYNPRHFAVAIGDKIYYSSINDASGEIPARGISEAWFAVTGDSKGGSNKLAAANDWSILLPVSQERPLQSAQFANVKKGLPAETSAYIKNTAEVSKETVPKVHKGLRRIRSIREKEELVPNE